MELSKALRFRSTLFLGRHLQNLLAPDREPRIEQITGITKVQVGEPVHFTGVT